MWLSAPDPKTASQSGQVPNTDQRKPDTQDHTAREVGDGCQADIVLHINFYFGGHSCRFPDHTDTVVHRTRMVDK